VPTKPAIPNETARPPAEGRSDLDLPGANREPELPDGPSDPQADLPERLGRRIEGQDDGIASGEPDLLPDVEVADAPM
jgi:hypothetical protein